MPCGFGATLVPRPDETENAPTRHMAAVDSRSISVSLPSRSALFSLCDHIFSFAGYVFISGYVRAESRIAEFGRKVSTPFGVLSELKDLVNEVDWDGS